jgi:hypothetical protein
MTIQSDESKEHKDQAAGSGQNEPFKFWIMLGEFFFWITSEGYTLEKETFEGSLGYVIKLHHKDNESDVKETPPIYAALKIPKLTGATHRENAYIIDLMEQEEIGAFEAFTRGRPEGLLDFYGPRNTFRQITKIEGKDEVCFGKGGIVLVNCAPGKLPRFCLVGNDFCYPNSIENKKILISHFSKLKEKVKDHTVFILKEKSTMPGSNDEFIDQSSAKTSDPIGDTWYAFLPNTVYRWADGTFQEAVSLGSRRRWDVHQQIDFLQQICKGIETLHGNGFIHADIRSPS